MSGCRYVEAYATLAAHIQLALEELSLPAKFRHETTRQRLERALREAQAHIDQGGSEWA